MNFIEVNAFDPYSEDPSDTNVIYIRPQNVVHIELYSGPYGIMAYAPNGQSMPTGKIKMIINASLIMLAMGGTRIVKETPSELIEKIKVADFQT